MALSYAQGSLQWTTGAVGTTFTVSGLSFQPKAIRLWCLGLNSSTDATSDTNHADMSIGFAVSTSSRASIAGHSEDANAAQTTARGYRTDCVLHTTSGTATDTGRLDLNSIASDGFQLIVDAVATRAQRVFWEAWGGSDITDASVGSISEPAATGNQDYTTTGAVQPDVVMFASCNESGASGSRTADNYSIGVGMATGASNEWCFAIGADDGNATGDTGRDSANDSCVNIWSQSAGPTLDARANFVQFNSDGFRLNWTARAVTGRKVIYLAIQGGQWSADSLTIDLTTLNATASASGLAFQPIGGLLASHGRSVGGTTFGALALGAFVSTSERQCATVYDEVGTTNAEIDHSVEYDQALTFPNTTGSPPGVLTSVDISAIASDGFTLTVDDAGGAEASVHVGYLTFASAGVTVKTATDSVAVKTTEESVVTALLDAAESVRVQLSENGFAVNLATAVDSLAVVLSEVTALLVSVDVADSTAVRLSEVVDLYITLDGVDSVRVQLSESVAIYTMVDGTDSVRVQLSEAAVIDLLLAASESVAVQIANETGNVQAQFTASESVRVQVAEASMLDVFIAVADALAVRLDEAVAILAMLVVADAPAVVLSENGAVAINEAGVVSIFAQDSLAVVLVESAALHVAVDMLDSLRVQVSESAALLVSLAAAEAVAVALSETGSVAVLVDAADSVRIQTGEAAALLVQVDVSEATRIGATETADLLVTLAASEAVVVVAVESAVIAAMLDAPDTVRVQLGENTAVTVEVTAAAELLGVRLDELATLMDQKVASDAVAVVVSEATDLDVVDLPSGSGGSGRAGWSTNEWIVKPTLYRIRRKW